MANSNTQHHLGRSLTTCRHCGSMLVWRSDRQPWQDGDVTLADIGIACCSNDDCAATFAIEVRVISLSDRLAPQSPDGAPIAASHSHRRHLHRSGGRPVESADGTDYL